MGRPEKGPQSEVDRVLHAIADPTRREIIERLSERPHSVSALAAPLGITVTAVAQHLQLLEQAGLVRTQKLGRVRSCQVEPGGFAVVEQWLGQRRTLWERRLDALAEMLAEPEDVPDGKGAR